jgi:hypothetical protein
MEEFLKWLQMTWGEFYLSVAFFSFGVVFALVVMFRIWKGFQDGDRS